ncbi:MAG: cell wall hydrolase [Gammaproteobacteria bacterium]|nr:cell wall hydrolase [Gammaproteobacteria bacterium]
MRETEPSRTNNTYRWTNRATLAVRHLVLAGMLALTVTAASADEQALPGDVADDNASAGMVVANPDAPNRPSGPAEQQDAHAAEIHCLALNIYFEARGESDTGQRAVAHVVMNRAAHPRFPSSVCGVVRQGGEKRRHRCQFSWWCDGRSDHPSDQDAWEESLRLAEAIYAGELPDITGGAMWYHADYVSPYWSKVLLKGDQIGQHIFYLERQATQNML